MSRGRRYEEPKLNMKKVVAVIVAILVLIMFVFIIKGILQNEQKANTGAISSTSYFAAFKDNKWGVIDSNGDIIIDPSYTEMIIVPDEKNDVFLCTYDINYETGEYKTKALNSKNQLIFAQYDKVEAISNKDENNNIWYESNVLRIKKDGKFGVIRFDGKEILKPEYDNIEAMQGIKNALLIEKDGKLGISDETGKIILDVAYYEIQNIGKDNKSGYIVKNVEGKYGLVDYSKNLVLENKYDAIEKVYGNDIYVVKEAGKLKVVEKGGKEILTEGFDSIKGILKTTGAGVIYQKNGKFGIMDLTGKIIIESSYEQIQEAKQGNFITKKDGKYGVIDEKNQEKVPHKYQTITYNEPADIYIAEDENFQASILDSNFEVKQKGMLIDLDTEKGYIKLKQGEEYKYFNFKFEEKNQKDILTSNTLYLSKKDGKYGFIDKDGNILVDYIYDDATEQNIYGFAAIKKDGKWGSIDKNGNVIIEPTYMLDNYLLIDFIGRWHLGQDINMNYYNQK